jgi:hypothetical protein
MNMSFVDVNANDVAGCWMVEVIVRSRVDQGEPAACGGRLDTLRRARLRFGDGPLRRDEEVEVVEIALVAQRIQVAEVREDCVVRGVIDAVRPARDRVIKRHDWFPEKWGDGGECRRLFIAYTPAVPYTVRQSVHHGQ